MNRIAAVCVFVLAFSAAPLAGAKCKPVVGSFEAVAQGQAERAPAYGRDLKRGLACIVHPTAITGLR